MRRLRALFQGQDKRMNEHLINKTNKYAEKYTILNVYTWRIQSCNKNLIKFDVLVTHCSWFSHSCVCRVSGRSNLEYTSKKWYDEMEIFI